MQQSFFLLFEITLTDYIKPHIERLENLVTQTYENLSSNDAANKVQNLSLNRINPDGSEENTQPDSGISKNEIEIAKESPDIRVDDVETEAEVKNKITEVDLPADENLASRNLTDRTFTRNAVDEVDKGSSAPGNRRTLSISEHRFLIHFNTNSSQLGSQASETLDKIVELITQNNDSETIIRGYTDSRGEYILNKQLSRYRADMVKNYLVARGISDTRIKALGLGSQNPIADNTTREGRSKNRRVEINVKM